LWSLNRSMLSLDYSWYLLRFVSNYTKFPYSNVLCQIFGKNTREVRLVYSYNNVKWQWVFWTQVTKTVASHTCPRFRKMQQIQDSHHFCCGSWQTSKCLTLCHGWLNSPDSHHGRFDTVTLIFYCTPKLGGELNVALHV